MIVTWLEDLPRPIIGWRNLHNAMSVAASEEKSKQLMKATWLSINFIQASTEI